MAAEIPKNRTQQIRTLGSEAQAQQQDVDRLPKLPVLDEDTRQKIAKMFVIFYFVILIIIVVGVPLYNLRAYRSTHDTRALQLSLTDTIQTYSAVVGPTIGFVIAYYFKSRDDR